jgi:hypothetical protein
MPPTDGLVWECVPLRLDARDSSPLVADRLGTAYIAVGLWKVVKRAARAAAEIRDLLGGSMAGHSGPAAMSDFHILNP